MSRPSIAPARGGALDGNPLARRATALGIALLVALPLAMWLANRSAPLLLTLATVAFATAVLAAGEGPAALHRLARGLRTPPALALAAFLLWALISVAWSHRPGPGLSMWGELALPLACGALIAASARFRPSHAALRALAAAILLAAILMAIEIASGMSQRIALGIGKQQSFVFNRPIITCLLLIVPAAHLLWTRPGAGIADRGLACLAALATGCVVVYGESGAAGLGMLVLVAVWVLARLLPRLTLGLCAVAFAATMLLAPVVGTLASRAMPPSLHDTLESSHSRDRVAIWLSFGEAVAARPLQGAGFGSTAALETHPVAQAVLPEHRLLLAVGHPHSAPLQAWAETGLIGALPLLAAGLLLLARLAPLPAAALAPRLALFASAFAIASVGHGAWQGWWIALLVAAALWLQAGRALETELAHG